MTTEALSPGATIGITGGGQLGRMLASAAADLGLKTLILAPPGDTPAADTASDIIHADWSDETAIAEFAKRCDVVTTEFENVPVSVLDAVAERGVPVRPQRGAIAIAQDRREEKTFLNRAGLETAPWREITSAKDLEAFRRDAGGRVIVKRARDGYDGKGQAKATSPEEVITAWESLGAAPCIAEGFAPFVAELSVIVARGIDGQVASYPVPQNIHRDGILRECRVPGQFDEAICARAREKAEHLVAALSYVGVLAVEFFVLSSGELLANEIAPRVHNSGHWTRELCTTCQFEQHIRAISGWPLGATDLLFAGEMINILGDMALDWQDYAAQPGWLTLYGKSRIEPQRKMGHFVRRTGLA